MRKYNHLIPKLFLGLSITLGILRQATAQVFTSGETHYTDVHIYRLKAWTTMKKNEWRTIIYRFPSFQEATLVTKGGFSFTKKLNLNFNIHTEAIEIITEKGDTVNMENSLEIKTIGVGDNRFYNNYPNGYVERLSSTPVALGARHRLKMMMETDSGLIFAGTDWNLPTSRYDRLYLKEDSYFFITSDEQLYNASWPSILKLFPGSRMEIKNFIRKNNIDFKKKDDLLKLLDFCNSKV